jgi:hypothetical protein
MQIEHLRQVIVRELLLLDYYDRRDPGRRSLFRPTDHLIFPV